MLGKLQKMDLREIWKHEALDFTKWLAKEENIDILCEEIGLDIQVLNTEVSVGSFSVDILAEETNTGNKVIIENQLETTNHDHLGKLITYASGLEASYVIWIFKDIREEHRKAIDWLNEISNGDVSFIAIQMELWKIGESLPAPKFNVVCSPNNWATALKIAKSNDTLSENRVFQLDFWKGLSEYLIENRSILKPRKPRAQHWYDFSIGSSQAHIAFILSMREGFIRCDFYIQDNKELFQKLFGYKEVIEEKLGFKMDWQELPDAKASRVAIRKDMKIDSEARKNEAYGWFKAVGEPVAKVFQEYLRV